MERLGFDRVCSLKTFPVNGYSNEEVSIKRELKQGDPFDPLLFLLVVDGLSGIMHWDVYRQLFIGLSVGDNGLVFSHLQYADATLLFGEESTENLWTMKIVLLMFELASVFKWILLKVV